MTTVYVYVMNAMADWEIGYCLAEPAKVGRIQQ